MSLYADPADLDPGDDWDVSTCADCFNARPPWRLLAATALVVALVELACRIPIRNRPDDRTCDDCPVLRHLKR